MSLSLPPLNPSSSSPSLSITSSSTMTPTPSQYNSSIPYNPQSSQPIQQTNSQTNLRVNTNISNNNWSSRLRSNSALSPRTTPNSLSPINTTFDHNNNVRPNLTSGGHGSSRSLGSTQSNNNSYDRLPVSSASGSTTSPSPLSPNSASTSDERDRNNDDVANVIRGLRSTSASNLHSPTSGNGNIQSPNGTSRISSRNTSGNGRLRTNGSSTTPPTNTNNNNNGPPTEEYMLNKIKEISGKSKDEGDTLDISRQSMTKITDDIVDLFERGVGKDKKGVCRLALSYNSLTNDSISYKFSQLSRLRYLNLKGNYLTEFPRAITELAGLEILDLSKNKITAFPDDPRRLSKLKVLSLTNNKIYTLPGYVVQFTSLKVFKVDHNPIEWPPKEVLGPLAESADQSKSKSGEAGSSSGKDKKDEDLRPWIENMKSWMRQRAADSTRLLQQAEEPNRFHEEEPLSATSIATSASARSFQSRLESPMATSFSQDTVKRSIPPPNLDDRPHTPSRPFTLGRNRSATFSDDALARSISPGPSQYSPYRPRHNRDLSSSSFTSPPSASTESSAHSRVPSVNLPQPPTIPAAQGHTRGASYTASQRLSGSLTVKKSLPDLRQSHAQIIEDRKNDGQPIEETRPLGLGIAAPGVPKFQLPGRGWGGDMIRSPTAGPTISGQERSRIMSRKGSIEMMRRTSGDMTASAEIAEKRNSQEGPQIDDSRNSYFRRLSTLPVSSISKSIPPALLKFMDAIRGILYALSQLHSALRQYLVFAVNERVASVFTRVMEPAGQYMNNLINALDRFDSMSRRNSPPVHAIRSVIDAAKESVAVFAKVVAVLKLQIPALKTNDVRYTRTLLTMIYGSMAEIACSWKNMSPLLSEIRPLLVIDVGGLAMRSMGGVKMVPTGSLSGRTPISPIIERRESQSPASVSKSTVGGSPLVPQVEDSPVPATVNTNATATSLRTIGKSRRQAGSFSSLDVERGMLMGSPGGPRSNETNSTDQLSTPATYLRHRPSESATIVLDKQAEEVEEDEEEEEEEEEPQNSQQAPIPPPVFSTNTISPNGTPFTIPGTPPEVVPSHQQPIAMIPGNSRQGGHHPSSSSGSSHAMAMSFTNGNGITSNPPIAPSRKLSVDVRPPTPSSASVFDEDLLDVIETATDTAFTCWLKLAEDIGASSPPNGFAVHQKSGSQSSIMSNNNNNNEATARLGHHPFTPLSSTDNGRSSRRPSTISVKHHQELLQLLSAAEQITAGLRESLMGLRANPASFHSNSTSSDLFNNLQSFIKTVIKVSNLVKIISSKHQFPLNVRQSCSKLTQSTRECAILIQVSSLKPTLTPNTSSSNTFSSSTTPNSATTPYNQHMNNNQTPSSAITLGGTRSFSSPIYNNPYNNHNQHASSSISLSSSSRNHSNLALNSQEDLSNPSYQYQHQPHSAGYTNTNNFSISSSSFSSSSSPWNDTDKERNGLRGLQLPSRQMALGLGLGRSKSSNAVPPINP
ncbi:uncharacterized protein L201_004798 [Kwoniella dendrophila CBS 6074]|uniref:Disease resistance R13L4/SHOC-2-like LRR domain-containing protein n=1 Tax=Kwoniella dendrophila CBS 6074 TaxID=1295534 RepID=A0AAX4JZ57_9TREE